MRFAMLGVSHETHTFSSRATTYAHFERSGILRGDEIRRRYRESQATLAGFFDAGARLGVEVVPLVFAITEPMGTITADAFDRIVGEMLERLRTGGPWDGVLLGQHGAAVSERHPDMDGEVTARVRAVVGPHVPVGLALDMHANVSPRMVELRCPFQPPPQYLHARAPLRRRRKAGFMVLTLAVALTVHDSDVAGKSSDEHSDHKRRAMTVTGSTAASTAGEPTILPVTHGHRIRQLDAVRGIAILVVILHNEAGKHLPAAWTPIMANGWMGVDLFFVLSGFLITGILLDTKGSQHFIRDFYIRRCLRIWPLYYSLLLFMFVLVPLVRPAEAIDIFGERSQPWWSYPLFLQNFFVTIPQNAAGPLGVTWSLGIEELFYLVWPWAVRSSSHRTLQWTMVVVVAVSPALRIVLEWYGVNLYANPFCRLDGLMAGALLASVVRMDGFRATAFVTPARMTLIVTALLAFVTESAGARWIAFSFVAIASMAFVYLSLFDTHPWLRRILSSNVLIYTGTISYGLYLLHKIPFAALASWGGANGSLIAFCVGLMVCYVLAFLSWHLLERPFLNLRRFVAPSPRTD